MAEQFLVLMADLDDAAQARMSAWYSKLQEAGFTGTQTPGLPYHISLGSFPLNQEQAVVKRVQKIAEEFKAVPVHLSHIGIFAPGKVLFCAPERNPMLDALHDACGEVEDPEHPWTPHATIFIDEPETVCEAVPVFVQSFQPFMARITRLHLCAFWPTREILSIELQ